jgi:hypothetical protein
MDDRTNFFVGWGTLSLERRSCPGQWSERAAEDATSRLDRCEQRRGHGERADAGLGAPLRGSVIGGREYWLAGLSSRRLSDSV